MLLRISSLILALVGIFSFPWALALSFAFIASLFTPPLALLFGVLMDVLYFVPGAYPIPLFTLIGLAGFLIALSVQSFVKTRIMSA